MFSSKKAIFDLIKNFFNFLGSTVSEIGNLLSIHLRIIDTNETSRQDAIESSTVFDERFYTHD